MTKLQEMCLDAGLSLFDEWLSTLPGGSFSSEIPGDRDLFIRACTRLGNVPRGQFKAHWVRPIPEDFEKLKTL